MNTNPQRKHSDSQGKPNVSQLPPEGEKATHHLRDTKEVIPAQSTGATQVERDSAKTRPTYPAQPSSTGELELKKQLLKIVLQAPGDAVDSLVTLIRQREDRARAEGEQAQHDSPMGVSEWEAYGRKYGYCKFFEDRAREDELKMTVRYAKSLIQQDVHGYELEGCLDGHQANRLAQLDPTSNKSEEGR